MSQAMNAHIVLIDNFDSFTYNLVDQFRSLGYPVKIYRNSLSAEQIEQAVSDLTNPVVVLSLARVRHQKQAACLH